MESSRVLEIVRTEQPDSIPISREDVFDRRHASAASWTAGYNVGWSKGARDREVPESPAGRRLLRADAYRMRDEGYAGGRRATTLLRRRFF